MFPPDAIIHINYWDRGAIRNPHIDGTIIDANSSKQLCSFNNKNGDADFIIKAQRNCTP
jgi:hypothetical protein